MAGASHGRSKGSLSVSLRYCWEATAPQITIVMLNPSTADERRLDPSLRRCVRFAQDWGYGVLEVVNLFAVRSPDPAYLRQLSDPVGIDNDRFLLSACHAAQRVIVAWGNGGRWQGRDRAFLELWPNHQSLYCLGITQQGQPRHPLYVRHNTVPVRWLDAQECNPVSANGKSAHRSHSHDWADKAHEPLGGDERRALTRSSNRWDGAIAPKAAP